MTKLNEKQVITILKKLHEAVGAPFNSIEECSEKDWYKKFSWTKEQEESFKNWLVSYYQKNFPITKDRAVVLANFFLLAYGWTYSE